MELHEHWIRDVRGGAAVGILSSKWASGRLRIFGLRAPKFLIGPGTVAVSVPMPQFGH
jgi:membrane-associated phospholipid phosphatase